MSESKKGRYIGAGIVLIILIVFFLDMQGYLGHRVDPGQITLDKTPPVDAQTTQAVLSTVDEFETAIGTVSSRKETIISSKIPAYIKHIYVRPGNKVQTGDLLALLDDKDLKARLGQVRSNLTAAEASQTQAENNYKRYQNLVKTGAATQAEFESAEAQFQVASAKVKEAGKALEEINVMLGYTEIKAPYSGVVVEKMIDEGTLAAPGVPILKLEDPEQLRLEVFVPESRRSSISEGKTLMVRIDTLNQEIPSRVDEIVPSADPRSRSFMVRLSLSPEQGVRSGMFGRCYLPIDSRKMILIDENAIYRIGQLEMVKVIKDNRLETRLVRLGNRYQEKVEVLSGLQSGETVLLMNRTEE